MSYIEDDIYKINEAKAFEPLTESDSDEEEDEQSMKMRRSRRQGSSIARPPAPRTAIKRDDDLSDLESSCSDLDVSGTSAIDRSKVARSSSEEISDLDFPCNENSDSMKKKVRGIKRRKSGTNRVLKRFKEMGKIKITNEMPSIDDILNHVDNDVYEDMSITLKVIFISGHHRFKVDKVITPCHLLANKLDPRYLGRRLSYAEDTNFMKFSKSLMQLVEEIAAYKKVEFNQIKLVLGDFLLDIKQSPVELGLDITSLIECTILTPKNVNKEFRNPFEIRISIQDNKVSNRNKKSVIVISSTSKLSVLFEKYANSRNLDASMLKFYFDGELLNPALTLQQCELEDDYCIDVKS